MLKILLRIIAFPILVLFVIAFPLSLALRNVGELLFDAETTRAFVRESLLGSELAASMARQGAQQLLTERNPEGSAPALPLSEEDWRQITEIIAPEELLGDTVDQVVTGFSLWLNGEEGTLPELSVDLGMLKNNALQRADEVMVVVLAALPACSAEDALNMAAQGSAGASGLPACSPPEPLYSQVVERADSVMARIIAETPNEIQLSQLQQGNQAPEELLQIRESLIRLRIGLAWGWAAILGIGIVAAVLAATGLRSFLAWAGWPLLLGGLFALVLGLSLMVFSFSFLDQLFAATIGEGSAAMAVLGGALAGGALNLVSQPLLLQGLLAGSVGLAAVLYARALDRRERSPGIPINRRRIGL